MAILKLIAIRDVKLNAFKPPLAFRTIGEAERAISNETNNVPQSMLYAHAEDHAVFQVGQYDEETGVIQTEKTPTHLFNVLDLKKKVN